MNFRYILINGTCSERNICDLVVCAEPTIGSLGISFIFFLNFNGLLRVKLWLFLKTCFMNMYTHTTIGSKLAEWGGSLDGRLLA